jgi:transposase-like protein
MFNYSTSQFQLSMPNFEELTIPWALRAGDETHSSKPLPDLHLNLNSTAPFNCEPPKQQSGQLPNPEISPNFSIDYLSELSSHTINFASFHFNWMLNYELNMFIKENQSKLPDGRNRLVRNGYMPTRQIHIPIGKITITQPRMEDRATEGESIKFTSKLIEAYKRTSDVIIEKALELYIEGISTGRFKLVMQSLFGDSTKGFSASSIARMAKRWTKDFEKWKNRDLSQKQFVYAFCDGVYFKIRGVKKKQCYLMVVGVTITGDKEIIAIHPAPSEKANNWSNLFKKLKKNGLHCDIKLFIGDEGKGLWTAIKKLYPNAKCQFCMEHKRRNILKHFSNKEMKNKVSASFNAIYTAETIQESLKQIIKFAIEFKKNKKAVDCLLNNLKYYLTYFDFPKEHWVHIKTSNPIESLFATIRLRINTTRGMSSTEESLSRFIFKLAMKAEKHFKMITAPYLLQNVAAGSIYCNGELIINKMQYNCNAKAA